MTDLAQLKAALADRYEVDREVGAGGMATVYLARDLKHDRRVALKVLKPELGAVLGVERFLAEIKVTANLQHPNLLPLFDSGAADGLLFYVMPFVEGESLRARLDREKQLPVDEAVHIGAAVASALDYAHRQGVIHRDLKPENILLHEGQPLVADFGIALAVSNAGGGRITQTGLSLGTPQYMSPEQATGDRAVDGRTDIYSLGAVTYEMLTGEAPHTGSTSQAVIARVLTEKPRGVRASRPNVPVHVEAAVEHALEKLAADRFATAKEFADALTGKVVLASAPSIASNSDTPGVRWTRREKVLSTGLAAALAVAAFAAIPGVRSSAAPDAPEIRFDIPVMSQTQGLQIAVSPDGKHVAFTTPQTADGKPVLWIRSLASSNVRVLPGTEGAGRPFWSPDSKEIAYSAGEELRRVAVAGGASQVVTNLARTGSAAGGSWSTDGVIVVVSGARLFQVAASGGEPSLVSIAGVPARTLANPQFLPDGRHFLFNSRGVGVTSGLYVGSLDDSTAQRLLPIDTRAVYSPLGYLLYVRGASLYAQRFDAKRLELSGEPLPVADSIGVNTSGGVTGFDVSSDNVLVYRQTGVVAFSRHLVWYSRDGKLAGTAGDTGTYSQINLSPDERFVAVDRDVAASPGRNVWIIDLGSNITSRLTTDSLARGAPFWFPDSRTVGFSSYRRGSNDFYRKAIGGATDSVLFESGNPDKYPEGVTRDGRSLIFHAADTLFSLSLDGARAPTVLATGIPRIDQAHTSPDGKWITYIAPESGRFEVYVATFPAIRDRRQVSAAGGGQPRWRGDGKELFYLTEDGMVMAVAVTPGPPIQFGTPTPLFRSPIQTPTMVIEQWAVARDGRKFLFNAFTAVGDTTTFDSPFRVVVNWTNVLKGK